MRGGWVIKVKISMALVWGVDEVGLSGCQLRLLRRCLWGVGCTDHWDRANFGRKEDLNVAIDVTDELF